MSNELYVILVAAPLIHFAISLIIAFYIIDYILGDSTWRPLFYNPYYFPCVFATFFLIWYTSSMIFRLLVQTFYATPTT